MNHSQLCLIGLDGATWDLLHPLIQDGVLPHIADIVKHGAAGRLLSTIPPMTPPAWTSLTTGVNPGKHGVFGFHSPPLGSGRKSQIPRIWHLLNEYGLRTGVFNVPLTYPPDPINGFMISGMMAPSGVTKKFSSYPQGLIAETEQNMGRKYQVDVPIDGKAAHNPDDFLTNIKNLNDIRKAALDDLLNRFVCDFFMAVFVTPDRIQHLLWKYLVPDHKMYHTAEGKHYRTRAHECFSQIDQMIGRIIASCDDSSTIMLCSDHGFGSFEKVVYLNNWLEKQGLLVRKGSSRWLQSGLRSLDFSTLKRYLAVGLRNRFRDQGAHSQIDWKRTKAYTASPDIQGVYVNLMGREAHGIVRPGAEYKSVCARIADGLQNLRDPQTGEKIVSSVFTKQQIYSGPFLDAAPDIFPVIENYSYVLSNNLFRKNLFSSKENGPDGHHERDGIFAIRGPNVVPRQILKNANLCDIAPTVLYALNQPVPKYMDGRVLLECFAPAWTAHHLPKFHNHPSESGTSGHEMIPEMTSEENEEIRKLLKALGYV